LGLLIAYINHPYYVENCENELNESEDNEEKKIQKNLKAIRHLLDTIDVDGLCEMWVEYNPEDGDYEIRSTTTNRYYDLADMTEELDYIDDTIRSWKLKPYIFTPNYVENCEDEGIDSFLDEISSKHNMSDELKDFVKQFIEESDCKRINFSRFKMGVMGLALESGVLINSVALNHPLPFLLFLIFHEVAHQYQFKKYGEDVMYDCYLGEISEREAAEFMKHTEEVADDFASRKIRQLQKLNLIGPYTPPQMYKNVPIQQITMMVNNYREDMRRKNIDSPKKVSEYFYNMIKSEL
jgi:hypothetical protein